MDAPIHTPILHCVSIESSVFYFKDFQLVSSVFAFSLEHIDRMCIASLELSQISVCIFFFFTENKMLTFNLCATQSVPVALLEFCFMLKIH
jgi:hypothetical protein